MHVLFFDIDGTLINTKGSGLESLRKAFVEIFDRPAPEQISACGRTDRGIARDLFTAHSIADSLDNWAKFRDAYLRHLAEQLPLRDGCVLPGVANLLQCLSAREDIALGLLTGNVQQGARIKLQFFGLYDHFSFGGYGEHHVERGGVASEALAAARRSLDGGVCLQRVWVIGDTPLDVLCARHIGVRAVAVATGTYAKKDLIDASPDLLLDDLVEASPLLAALDGAPAV
jgi:phosphoglycolate phosphatase-like HAD superfamily hydrolase